MNEISSEVEYEQKWEYLRHIEESRRKSVQLFFILIAGVGSYLTTADWALGSVDALGLTGVLLVLTIVAVFLLYFLVFQKVEYQRHLKRIDELDGCSMGRAEGTVDDPFRWFFAAVQTTGAALAGTLVVLMVVPGFQAVAVWLDWTGLGRSALAVGIVLGIAAAALFWNFFESVVSKTLAANGTAESKD